MIIESLSLQSKQAPSAKRPAISLSVLSGPVSVVCEEQDGRDDGMHCFGFFAAVQRTCNGSSRGVGLALGVVVLLSCPLLLLLLLPLLLPLLLLSLLSLLLLASTIVLGCAACFVGQHGIAVPSSLACWTGPTKHDDDAVESSHRFTLPPPLSPPLPTPVETL
jgi:hypothetical protein